MPEIPITIACGNYDRTAGDQGRPRQGRRLRRHLSAALPGGDFPPRLQVPGVRRLRDCRSRATSRTVAAGTSAYIGIPAFVSRHLPPFRHLHPQRRRHQQAGGPARQAHRPARVPDHRGGLDARHAAARVRREAVGDPLALRRPGAARPRTSARRSSPFPASTCKPIPEDKTLVGMLRDGELDALFTARAPSSFLAGEPHIARLFPDTRAAETRLLQEDRAVPDHAPDRHPQVAGRAASVARRPASTRRSARPRRWR